MPRKLTPEGRLRKIRRAIIAEQGRKCERCGAGGELHLHHRHYRTVRSEEREDMVLLCKRCHFSLHDRHHTGQLLDTDIPYVDPLWTDEHPNWFIPERDVRLKEILADIEIDRRGTEFLLVAGGITDVLGECIAIAHMERVLVSYLGPECKPMAAQWWAPALESAGWRRDGAVMMSPRLASYLEKLEPSHV